MKNNKTQQAQQKNFSTLIGMLFMIASFVAVAIVLTSQPMQRAFAINSTQTVNVVVQGEPLAIAIDQSTVDDDGAFHTTNSESTITVDVTGAGVVTVTDQNGNILWTYDKTTDETETFTVPISIKGDPGEYILTATIVSADDPARVATDTCKIIFEATSIIPSVVVPPIFPPNTGYMSLLGRVVPVEQVLTLSTYIMIIMAIGSSVVAGRKKAQQNYDALAARNHYE